MLDGDYTMSMIGCNYLRRYVCILSEKIGKVIQAAENGFGFTAVWFTQIRNCGKFGPDRMYELDWNFINSYLLPSLFMGLWIEFNGASVDYVPKIQARVV